MFFAPELWSGQGSRTACVAWLQKLRDELSQRRVEVVGIFLSAPGAKDDQDSHHTVTGTRSAAVKPLSQATVITRFDDYEHFERSEAAEPKAEAAATAVALAASFPPPHVEWRFMRSVGMRPRSAQPQKSHGVDSGSTTYEVRNYTFGEAGWAVGKDGYCRWAAAEVVATAVLDRTDYVFLSVPFERSP